MAPERRDFDYQCPNCENTILPDQVGNEKTGWCDQCCDQSWLSENGLKYRAANPDTKEGKAND
jgi:hypothetical protein